MSDNSSKAKLSHNIKQFLVLSHAITEHEDHKMSSTNTAAGGVIKLVFSFHKFINDFSMNKFFSAENAIID